MTRKRYEIISTTFDKRGRPIAIGVNDYKKSNPLMKTFAKLAGESDQKIWVHSEMNSVLKSKHRDIDSILVQRFDSYGNAKLAKPCKTCTQMLKSFGIRVVRYSSEDGIQEELVKDMK